MEIHELIGAGIRATRERKGWRQEDAAREFRRNGLTTWRRSTVAGVEAGRRHPSIGDLLLVATALEVTMADLIPDAAERVEIGNGASVTAAYVRALLSGDWEAVGELPVDDSPDIPGDERDRLLEQVERTAQAVEQVERLAAVSDRAIEAAERLNDEWERVSDSIAEATAAEDVERRADPLDHLASIYGELLPILNSARHVIDSHELNRVAYSQTTEAESRAAVRLGIDPAVLKVASLALWGHAFEAERDARANTDSGDAPSAIQARRGHAARAMHAELKTFIESAYLQEEGTHANDQDD